MAAIRASHDHATCLHSTEPCLNIRQVSPSLHARQSTTQHRTQPRRASTPANSWGRSSTSQSAGPPPSRWTTKRDRLLPKRTCQREDQAYLREVALYQGPRGNGNLATHKPNGGVAFYVGQTTAMICTRRTQMCNLGRSGPNATLHPVFP
jgi:hypothetical protein